MKHLQKYIGRVRHIGFLRVIISMFIIGYVSCGLLVGLAFWVEKTNCRLEFKTRCEFRAVPTYFGNVQEFGIEYKTRL